MASRWTVVTRGDKKPRVVDVSSSIDDASALASALASLPS